MRRTVPESALNAGNTLVGASVVALVGPIGMDTGVAQDFRATAAAFLYLLINLALAVLPVALDSGRPYLSLFKRAASATWPASTTLGACAVSIAVLAVEAPVAAPLPLIVLPMTYRMNHAIEAQKAGQRAAGCGAGGTAPVPDRRLAPGRDAAGNDHDQPVDPGSCHAQGIGPGSGGRQCGRGVRMKRMLGRLRALAHADEDVPLRRELVDLAELTADVVRAYAAQAATSGVGLVTEVGVHASVRADKDLLREALANLVDNAVRVSPRGAEVRLRVDRGFAGPQIAVADSGPGIEEERLPRLFERFQRSDSGSGLGLAIARRVVERHGGTTA